MTKNFAEKSFVQQQLNKCLVWFTNDKTLKAKTDLGFPQLERERKAIIM